MPASTNSKASRETLKTDVRNCQEWNEAIVSHDTGSRLQQDAIEPLLRRADTVYNS